jgi:hypothetical protein
MTDTKPFQQVQDTSFFLRINTSCANKKMSESNQCVTEQIL